MKIKLQVNGENPEQTGEFGDNMIDSEYEIEMKIDSKNLEILQDLLERAIDSNPNLFNWSIIKK